MLSLINFLFKYTYVIVNCLTCLFLLTPCFIYYILYNCYRKKQIVLLSIGDIHVINAVKRYSFCFVITLVSSGYQSKAVISSCAIMLYMNGIVKEVQEIYWTHSFISLVILVAEFPQSPEFLKELMEHQTRNMKEGMHAYSIMLCKFDFCNFI